MDRLLTNANNWASQINASSKIVPTDIVTKHKPLPEIVNVLTHTDLQSMTLQITELMSTVSRLQTIVDQLSSNSIQDNLNHIHRRIDSLEQSLSASQTTTKVHPKETIPLDSDFSVRESADDKRVFLPFCSDISQIGISNTCTLVGTELKLTVESNVRDTDVIIYPFGKDTDLPKFTEDFQAAFSFSDNSDITGIAYAILKVDKAGVYSFHIDDLIFTEDNDIKECKLPLKFSCSVELPLD